MITKEFCIEEILRVNKEYGKVTDRILKEHGIVSGDTLQRLFGSRAKAYEAAGIQLKQGQRKMVEKEEIIIEINRIIKEFGYFSKPLMEKHSSYSPKIVQRIFGNFSNAYKELNIERSRNGIIPTDDELITEAKRLYDLHGDFSMNIVEKYGKYSITCYKDRSRIGDLGGVNYYREKIGCKIPNLGWGESPIAKCQIAKFTKFLNEKPKKEKVFDWLVNDETGMKLRIDAYYEKNNIAIEYNGPQHYAVDNHYIKTEEALLYRKNLDCLKRKLIEEHKIKVIVIHYKDIVDDEYIKRVLQE